MTASVSIPLELKGTLPEAPLDELAVHSQEYDVVPVYLKQRNNKSQFVQLRTMEFPVGDLMTDAIANYLRDNYGGGTFICEPRNPSSPTQRLTKPWYVSVTGAPKIPTTASITGSVGLPPSQAELQAGYRAGFVPTMAGQISPQGVQPRDVMSFTSDQIAVEQLREVREENKRLRTESANKDRAQQQKFEALQKQLQDIQLASERARAEAREAALLSQIEQVKQMVSQHQNQPAAKPTLDIPALLIGLVPVFVQMISTSKERQQMQLEAQQKSSEQHSTMLATLMKRPEENPLKSLMELALPLLSTLGPKLLEAVNPSKTADLIATMGENQMQMVALAAQAIQSLAPDPETPGMQFARAIIDGVTGIAEQAQAHVHAQQSQQQLQPQQVQTRVMPQQAQPQQVRVETVNHTTPPPAATPVAAQGGRQVRSVAGQPRNARELAQAIVSDPMWPDAMRTPAWVRLLTTLHSYDRNPETVGEEIAKMLEGMQKTGQLPAEIAVMFDDDGPAPSTVLLPVFAVLPIAQNDSHKPFLEVVLAMIDHMYDADASDDNEIVDAETAEELAVVAANGADPDTSDDADDESAAAPAEN